MQVELPEPWIRHIDVEAAKRGTRRRGLVVQALTAFIGEPHDYDKETERSLPSRERAAMRREKKAS